MWITRQEEFVPNSAFFLRLYFNYYGILPDDVHGGYVVGWQKKGNVALVVKIVECGCTYDSFGFISAGTKIALLLVAPRHHFCEMKPTLSQLRDHISVGSSKAIMSSRTILLCSVLLLNGIRVTSFQSGFFRPVQEQLFQLGEKWPYFARGKRTCCFAGSKKYLSAAEKERREEENRRRERMDDVVIGKTSAKRGENDFELDPKSTELEWLRLASKSEQAVFHFTDEGLKKLKLVGRQPA